MPASFHSVAAAASLREGPSPSVLALDELLGALGVMIRREASEEIFAEGEEAEAVHQIVSGAVRSYRILGDGRRHVCDFHMPGDVLGLEAGETHLCTAEGMTPVILRATPRRVLQRQSVENGLLAQRLWNLTVCGMRRSQDHASMLSRLGATERVAAFLVTFADRLGVDDELELPMTRQDIADYLGLTIHTVSRTLSQLEDMGMIDARGDPPDPPASARRFGGALRVNTSVLSPIQRDHAARNLPRYTSYPTAVAFESVEMVGAQNWCAATGAEERLSAYVHVPFFKRMCWYCGCHTTIAHTYDRVGAFHTTLMREVDLVADRLGEHDGLAHLHFGGGSPNALSPEHFLALVQRLKTRLAVRPDAEIAVEVDPGLLSAAFVEAMGEAGVTRASLGVQTFDLDVQTRVNRVQPFERVAQSVEQLRAARVGGLNFDIGAVCREHGVAENRLDAALADAAALEAAGLCVREERRLTIPEPARRLMRVVAALFDERLPQAKTRHAPAV